MTDKTRANQPETVEQAVKPAAYGKPKETQTTVEGAVEVMTQAGPEETPSKK
jgi:hypothetical protein